MKSRNLVLIALVGIAALTALTGCLDGPAAQPRPTSTANGASPNDATPADGKTLYQQPCPVTVANGSQPPGETVRSSRHHGNGMLWTVLPEGGKIAIPPNKEGTLDWKFPWWRGVVGRLVIEGRRLDGTKGEVTSRIPDGYGDTGFQSTAVFFPSEGCWEITGRAGDGELKFVVAVRKKGENTLPRN